MVRLLVKSTTEHASRICLWELELERLQERDDEDHGADKARELWLSRRIYHAF